MSMRELAEKTGLSLRVVYYLRDGRQPNADTIEALMRAFPELTFGDLFVPADSTTVQSPDTDVEDLAATA